MGLHKCLAGRTRWPSMRSVTWPLDPVLVALVWASGRWGRKTASTFIRGGKKDIAKYHFLRWNRWCCSCAIKQAGTDPCVHCLDVTCSDGRYGWQRAISVWLTDSIGIDELSDLATGYFCGDIDWYECLVGKTQLPSMRSVIWAA